MSNIYLGAGKGDTPRSCNSKAYLDNYERLFKNARRKMPDDSENAQRKENPRKSTDKKQSKDL